MVEWRPAQLGDLLREPTRNGIHKGKAWQGRGVPLIKMGEVYSSSYVGDDNRDLLDLSPAELDRLSVHDDDLLFCRTSLVAEGVGRCALVRGLTAPAAFASNLIRVRVDDRKADPRFIFWVFRSSVGRALCHSIARGTSVTTITGPDLARLEIALPPLPEQRAIAEVLGALDDKIESNRNQILSSDHLYLSICEEALSHRSTCQPTRLGDVAEVSLGGTPSRKNPDFWMEGTIPWVNSGCLHERPLITPADWITDEGLARSSTKLIEPGAVLVAITGATLGVVSRLGIRAAINQSVVAISCPEAPPLEGFLYYWIRSRVERLVSSATGGAQQHINKGNVEDFPVEVPDDDALVRIGAALPLLDRQVALTRQNQILESLRDTLLPELLAGRIRVSEAREHVEDSP